MLQGCKKFKYFKLHKRLPEKNGGKNTTAPCFKTVLHCTEKL